jgi:hypothetical protein
MSEPPSRRRFQIHLSTAIVLMIAAGTAIGWWTSQRKVHEQEKVVAEQTQRAIELENELELMRRQFSNFEDDVIVTKEVRVERKYAWAWTVYFSRDCEISVTVDVKNIGGVANINTSSFPVQLKKGLYRMQAEIERREDGQTIMHLTLPSHVTVAQPVDVSIASKPSDSDWIFYSRWQGSISSGTNLYTKGVVGLFDLNARDGTTPNPGLSITLIRK